jgi:hypothetical protein
MLHLLTVVYLILGWICVVFSQFVSDDALDNTKMGEWMDDIEEQNVPVHRILEIFFLLLSIVFFAASFDSFFTI